MKRSILSLFLLSGMAIHAQKPSTFLHSLLHGWEYEVKAGVSIGGITPLPLPREIRSIESYNPTLLLSIEGNMTRWIVEQRWGILIGIRLENKGMKTDAQVKNYGMEIVGSDGNRLAGNWTGHVHTKVHNTYLTFPIQGVCRMTSRLQSRAGFYLSYLTDGDFSGHVSDGYLRKDNPTGDKVNFNNGASASYDFSNHLRRFQWGLQAGIDWRASTHLKLSADLTWGLNGVFHSGFHTVTFGMYPVFLNVGFGYAF